MLRHGAPSPTLSNPLETRGLGHGVPSFKGFRLSHGILLHPFAGFGWADTTGGGGATSSCTVGLIQPIAGTGKRTACGASCWYGCIRLGWYCRGSAVIAFSMPFGIGADTAEGRGADTAEGRSCLGGGGCKLRPPSGRADAAVCGFGTGASSSLSNKYSPARV